MAHYTKKQLARFDDYDDLRKARLNSNEIKKIDREASDELEALKAMQESLTREIAAYMAKEAIGIVELTKRLATSSRQTSRIMKGEANVTLATLAEVAILIGKMPRIVFEDSKPKKKVKAR
jgi:hypothetical protein